MRRFRPRTLAFRPRTLAAAVSVAALLPLAAGCGGGGDTVEADDSGMYQIPITVTHYPTLLYAVPYVVGMEQGFFADENIEITDIAGSEGGGTTVRNVVNGDLPFGEVATSGAIQARAQGSKIVAVGGGVQSVAEINFVAMKNKGPAEIGDLAGKKVAYTSPGSVTQGVLALALDDAGIDPQQVESKALGGVGEGLTALESGVVDAAANLEPVYSGNPDPYQVVFWANDHVPDFQQTVIITGEELVENQPDLVEAFLRARAKAVQWVNDNPEQAADLWAKAADIDPEVARSALTTVLKDDYYGVGFAADGLDAVDKEMRVIDLIPEGEDVPWADFINPDLLPEGAPSVDPSSIGSGS